MSSTLKCPKCGTIHTIKCPNCGEGNQQALGSLDLGPLNVNVEVSIAHGATRTVLRIQKPSGQILVPLENRDLYLQFKPQG